MAKTTIILELEYPDDMLAHTIEVVTEENPELYAEGQHPDATNEELALNGWLSAMLGRIELASSQAERPILLHGAKFSVEANNRVGSRDFPIAVTMHINEPGEEH